MFRCPVCHAEDVRRVVCGPCVRSAKDAAAARLRESRAAGAALKKAAAGFVPAAVEAAGAAGEVGAARKRIATLQSTLARLKAHVRETQAHSLSVAGWVAKTKTQLPARRAALDAAVSAWSDTSEAVLLDASAEAGSVQDVLRSARRALVVELASVLPLNPCDEGVHSMAGLELPDQSIRIGISSRSSSSSSGGGSGGGGGGGGGSRDDVFAGVDDAVFDAVLGHVVRLVSLLEKYLAVLLPYPVVHHGSRSLVGYTPVGPWVSLFRNTASLGDTDEVDATLAGLPSAVRTSSSLVYDWREGLGLLNHDIAALAAASAGLQLDPALTDSPLPHILSLLRSPYIGAQGLAYSLFLRSATPTPLGYTDASASLFRRLQTALAAHRRASAAAGPPLPAALAPMVADPPDDDWELV